MVTISQKHLDQIIFQAQAELPNECCGMLAGTVQDGIGDIAEIYPLTNIDHSPEHFSLDPKEQFQVLRTARECGLILLGNYHSHPETPSRPSLEDIRLAHDPKAIYMIVSLMDKIPVLKCFSIQNGEYTELPLIIKQSKE